MNIKRIYLQDFPVLREHWLGVDFSLLAVFLVVGHVPTDHWWNVLETWGVSVR